MATEGFLWFTDLVAVDSTYALPIASAMTWLWNVEAGGGVFYDYWQRPKMLARTAAVAFIPLTATLPAGVFLFWVTSNVFAVARTYVMRTDAARRMLRVPLRSEIAALAHLPRSIG